MLGLGLCPPFLCHPLQGGQNNRSYRLQAGSQTYLLKHYWIEPGGHDRLGTEYELLRLLRQHQVSGAPEALGMEPALGLGLYEFVPGCSPTQELAEQEVGQAARFLESIQTARSFQLRPAADACLDPARHLAQVGLRLDRFDRELQGARLRDFFERELRGRWAARRLDRLPEPLPAEQLILSPSDFGFHNALVLADGQLCFLDFEYAGLDDPAKTLCDFFCQPRFPMPMRGLLHFQSFLTPPVLTRMAWMWRLTLLKWALILMNPFLQQIGQRKRFATPVPPAEAEQVAKAERIFAREQAFLDQLEGQSWTPLKSLL